MYIYIYRVLYRVYFSYKKIQNFKDLKSILHRFITNS